MATGLEQRLQHLVNLAVVLVDPAEGEQVALAGLTVGVAVGLHDLGVGVTTGASELDEHGASVATGAKEATTRDAKCLHYKKIQKNAAKCLIHMDPTPANGEKKGWKCRTRVFCSWTTSHY